MPIKERTRLKRIRTHELRTTLKIMKLLSELEKEGKLPGTDEDGRRRLIQIARYAAELLQRDARDALQ